MYRWLRPWLFRVDPERAHHASLRAMQLTGAVPPIRSLVRSLFGPRRDDPVEAFGLRFPNRIGLAAGYDKDGHAWRGLSALGFGHVEVGTVTPRPQPGNPRPRVFRLPEDESLINRLGFPSDGAPRVEERLSSARPYGVIVGINLGKNKDTPNDEAARDYTQLVSRFAPHADYLVVNVSSPNTEGLRDLQARESLRALLGAVVDARDATAERPPLLVKLSPDLGDEALDDALDVVLDRGLDGIIATNTTITRDGLRSASASERGGLSGAALGSISPRVVATIVERTGGKVPVIGVGGVRSPDDVSRMLDAGATLVQLYTGLIYEGPSLVRRLVGASPTST